MQHDNSNFKIQLFEGQKVRTAWSEEEQLWYFSIIDICWILTESKDYDTARKYWNKLKQRLVEEGDESVTNCHQLKLISPKDGKRYLTDVATLSQLFRIIQSIPSKKGEALKEWLGSLQNEQQNHPGQLPSNILIYSSEDGSISLDVKTDGDTVWLTVQQMADLFGRDRTVIGKHIANVYEEGELQRDITCAKFAHMGTEGDQQYTPDHYNLDVIISVGYRVHSIQGVRFRQWATTRLKEYIIKGFTIDSERLKGNGGGQYWYELLNTIKDIRSSEKVLYRQVLDLYATSVDYNASDEETILFFKMVQNKLHYATHGQTAAELIYSRADADKEFMGLTTFRGPQPTKAEVTIAKNYLSETELRKLNNMVSGYFDFAENRALDHIPTTMHDYRVMLDNILSAGGNAVLQDAGSISAAEARAKALDEYRKYQVRTLSPVEQAYIAQLKAAIGRKIKTQK